MIRLDEAAGVYFVTRGRRRSSDAEIAAEIAALDAALERVSPDDLRWLAPGVEAPRVRGLGDVVKILTGLAGFRTCGPCEKRRQWLNEKVPFVSNPKE